MWIFLVIVIAAGITLYIWALISEERQHKNLETELNDTLAKAAFTPSMRVFPDGIGHLGLLVDGTGRRLCVSTSASGKDRREFHFYRLDDVQSFEVVDKTTASDKRSAEALVGGLLAGPAGAAVGSLFTTKERIIRVRAQLNRRQKNTLSRDLLVAQVSYASEAAEQTLQPPSRARTAKCRLAAFSPSGLRLNANRQTVNMPHRRTTCE